jgi:F420-dependent oxidoreductase-like protein
VTVRLGIMIAGQEGLTWDHWRTAGRAADTLGFDSIWRSDHLLSLVGDSSRRGLDTWTSLAILATITERVRIGPLVSPVTFHHPSILARQAATLDELSGGRLELGLGAGWYDAEHRMFGVPYPPIRERIDRLEEAIRVICALWGDGAAHFTGTYYRLQDARGWPKPVQQPRIPLVVGGKGRRMLQVVAQHADEWNCGGNQTPSQVRERTALLVAACEKVGRDANQIRRSWQGGFLIGESAAALERRAHRIKEFFPEHRATPSSTLPGVLRGRGWLVGSAVDIAEQIHGLAAEGISRVVVQYFDLEDAEALELLASGVMPALA